MTTAACGFAVHVRDADAGVVLNEPFRFEDFRVAVGALLDDPAQRASLGARGRSYTRRPELYGRQQFLLECVEGLHRRRQRAVEAALPRSAERTATANQPPSVQREGGEP